MRYTDLQLLARDPSIVEADGKKLLTFTLIVPGVLEEATKCELERKIVRELKKSAIAPGATWKQAGELGEALSSALLPPKIFNIVNDRITVARAKNEGLRIRLILSGSELNNLPWEFLLFNRAGGEAKVSDFLCLMPNVSVVRHTASPLPAWGLEETLPVKIVVAAASPEQWPSLNVSREVELIKKALDNNSQVVLSTFEHAGKKGIPDKTNPAQIFHFAGHGQFEQQQSAQPGKYEGKSSVILEDEHGDEDVLDADLLAVRLRDAGVRVAVLGACQTAQRDDVKTWSSVAEALLKAEVGAVLGMQFPVLDVSATAFAESFYGALTIGLSIDEAVSAGRVAIASADDPRGWANPALHLRAPDGVVFPAIAKDPNLKTAREQTMLNVSQRVKKVASRLIGIRIHNLQPGVKANVEMVIEEVTEGGEAVGMEIGHVGGQQNYHSREIRTGGGTYVEGGVQTGGGEFVGRDKNVHGDELRGDKISGDKTITGNVSNSTVATGSGVQGSSSQGVSGKELAPLFDLVYRRIESRPQKPEVDKEELKELVSRIQAEAGKGDEANPAKLQRWLRTLADVAPDILEVTISSLINPAAGVASAIRTVAERVWQERGSS